MRIAAETIGNGNLGNFVPEAGDRYSIDGTTNPRRRSVHGMR